MQQLRHYIALFLFLLFLPAMVPEGALLRQHTHEHTTHEVPTDHQKAQVEKKHTHCHVGDLFGAPFHPSFSSAQLLPVAHTSNYIVAVPEAWTGVAVLHPLLRGPPVL